MEHFHKASFTIDSLPDKVFSGYTDGEEWNGWACPYYERHEAEQILKFSETNGYWWQYDQENDAFIVGAHTEENNTAPEMFRSLIILVDDKPLKVYPIGTRAWIWEEAPV